MSGVSLCHCGQAVDTSEYRNRGMCTECDDNRCDTSDGMAAGCPGARRRLQYIGFDPNTLRQLNGVPGVTSEQLDDWERDASNKIFRRDRPHGSPQRVMALVSEVRAARAEIVRLREIVNKQKARPDYRELHRKLSNERRNGRRARAERDTLRRRTEKAADLLGLIHSSLSLLVMDTPEQQGLHDRQLEVLNRARDALLGYDTPLADAS